MLGEQNLSSMFPNTLFTNIRPLCGLFGLYGLEGQTKDISYRISLYSFLWNYSFLNLVIHWSQYIRPKVTVHKCAETIQVRKLFKGENYMRKIHWNLTNRGIPVLPPLYKSLLFQPDVLGSQAHRKITKGVLTLLCGLPADSIWNSLVTFI